MGSDVCNSSGRIRNMHYSCTCWLSEVVLEAEVAQYVEEEVDTGFCNCVVVQR